MSLLPGSMGGHPFPDVFCGYILPKSTPFDSITDYKRISYILHICNRQCGNFTTAFGENAQYFQPDLSLSKGDFLTGTGRREGGTHGGLGRCPAGGCPALCPLGGAALPQAAHRRLTDGKTAKERGWPLSFPYDGITAAPFRFRPPARPPCRRRTGG